MKLTLIPAGQFTMGSEQAERLKAAEEYKRLAHSDKPVAALVGLFGDEGPQREVKITKPFYMAIYEVTQAQWTAIMGTTVVQQRDKAGPSWPLVGQGDNYPMYYVSWEEAAEFCRRLSHKTGKMVRLPTEAEWEYACRAGTKTPFSFGDDYADLHKYCNYCDRSNTLDVPYRDEAHSDGHDKTAPVGSLKPNGYGLYDTHGNVGEWCLDWYADSYSTAQTEDPTGPASGRSHILRGGSWSSHPAQCRSAYRSVIPPDGVIHSIVSGFRVVVTAAREHSEASTRTGVTATQAVARGYRVVKEPAYQMLLPEDWQRSTGLPEGIDGFRRTTEQGHDLTFLLHWEQFPVDAGEVDNDDVGQQFAKTIRSQYPDAKQRDTAPVSVNGKIVLNQAWDLTEQGVRLRRR